jgi:hypothetical protein
MPQFGYQLHLASGEVEKVVNDEHSIRQFLKGMYGGHGSNGEVVFDPSTGVLLDNLSLIGDSRLLNGKVCLQACASLQLRRTVLVASDTLAPMNLVLVRCDRAGHRRGNDALLQMSLQRAC